MSVAVTTPIDYQTIPKSITHITLSRNNLKNNLTVIQKCIGKKKICCVVKSDAYGHGLSLLVPELVNQGQSVFAVASMHEALWIRQQYPAVRIILLMDPLENTVEKVLEFQIEPTLRTPEDLHVFRDHQAVFEAQNLQVHFKIETGMGRLGLSLFEIKSYLSENKLNSHHKYGLMTHFACSESPEDPLTKQQVNLFKESVAWAKSIHSSWEVHGANSAATLNGLVTDFTDLFRTGIAIYGGMEHDQLKPILTWESTLSAIRHIPKGQYVGYSHTWQAPRDTRIATIPVGYRLGYRLSQSNQGWISLGDVWVPVIGRISMDMMTVDVTDIALSDTELIGQSVMLVSTSRVTGGENNIFTLAQNAGTITYEIYCGINPGIHREWQDEG
jgi:alanine racemase